MVSVSEGEDLFEGCRLNLFCNDVRIYMITLTITYGHTATNNEGKEVKKETKEKKTRTTKSAKVLSMQASLKISQKYQVVVSHRKKELHNEYLPQHQLSARDSSPFMLGLFPLHYSAPPAPPLTTVNLFPISRHQLGENRNEGTKA